MNYHFASFSLLMLALFCLVADAIRIIRENGFREDTYYYHLGDGGYTYHYNAHSRTSVYFKCVMYERGCRGRAILRLGSRFRHSKDHNHDPDPDFVASRQFRQAVVDRCREQQWVDFHEIVAEERRNTRYNRRVRARMTLARLRTTMRSARSRLYPNIPATLRELTQLLNERGNEHLTGSIDGEDNLYAGSVTAADGSHHVVFMSQRMMQFAQEVKLIHSDGTFRSRPAVPHSCQCFSIVTSWRNHIIPLGWVLMERRTQPAYTAVFRLLKELMPNFRPSTIITDFEAAQQNAWAMEFRRATLQGCLWHFARALVRKARKLRVMRYKNVFPLLLPTIRKVCTIAVLPGQHLRHGLNVLRTDVLNNDVIVAYLLDPFFEYVEKKWIDVVTRRRWMSVFMSDHRTNNVCESHNRMLRAKVGPYRPNIFAFIKALASLEHNACLDLILLREGGNPSRARRWTAVANDRSLQNLSNDLIDDIYHDRDIALRYFLSRASHCFHTAFNGLVNGNRRANPIRQANIRRRANANRRV